MLSKQPYGNTDIVIDHDHKNSEKVKIYKVKKFPILKWFGVNVKMHLSSDVSNALQQMEIVKQAVEEMEPNKIIQLSVMDDLKMLIDLLQDPVFRNIVQIQDSLAELNTQIIQHPSILPADFDINNSGELSLNVPPSSVFDSEYPDEQRVPSAQISPSSPAISTHSQNLPHLVNEAQLTKLTPKINNDASNNLLFDASNIPNNESDNEKVWVYYAAR